jgi:hypothetical protein
MLQLCFGLFKGLFVYSPILLLGLIGLLVGLRAGKARLASLFGLLVFLGYLAFNSTLGTHVPDFGHHFWGGLSVLWGPRYLFGVLPFLAGGLALLDWSRTPVRRFCYGFLLISVAFNILGAMFSHLIMSTNAFGAELRYPLPYAIGLLLRRGPRIPLLDGYGVHPVVQILAFLILVGVSIVLLRGFLKRGVDSTAGPPGRGAFPGSGSGRDTEPGP